MLWKNIFDFLTDNTSKQSNSADINLIPDSIHRTKVIFDTPVTELPHPEESQDFTRTLENTSFNHVLNDWFKLYNVPIQYHEFWRKNVRVSITDNLSTPAATWEQDGLRHLAIKPEWLNPGVLAHELAHTSYSLLTDTEKENFSKVYSSLNSHPLITLLHSKKAYAKKNLIEGHAEIYRYLGEKMPEQLKQYYPSLF